MFFVNNPPLHFLLSFMHYVHVLYVIFVVLYLNWFSIEHITRPCFDICDQSMPFIF